MVDPTGNLVSDMVGINLWIVVVRWNVDLIRKFVMHSAIMMIPITFFFMFIILLPFSHCAFSLTGM